MLRPLRIGITSGDADGIGPEVVAKSLRKIGPRKNVQFILWRNSSFPKRDLERIKRSFKLVTVGSWSEALKNIPKSPKDLLDICSVHGPARWVEEAGSACFFKHLDAMATAPLSKPAIRASGLSDLGHTEILKRLSRVDKAYMTFLGSHFNVMVLTGHQPLRDVPDKVTSQLVIDGGLAAHRLCALLGKNKKPLALLGLNPHAGDQGLIGDEETRVLAPALDTLRRQGLKIEGPLVPDAAFTPTRLKEFSLFLALYHDQGLIPFKALHGQKGLHLTWGLPFVRTSVDHGTAFDIAGEDRADPSSMQLAIEWAIKLCSGA